MRTAAAGNRLSMRSSSSREQAVKEDSSSSSSREQAVNEDSSSSSSREQAVNEEQQQQQGTGCQ